MNAKSFFLPLLPAIILFIFGYVVQQDIHVCRGGYLTVTERDFWGWGERKVKVALPIREIRHIAAEGHSIRGGISYILCIETISGEKIHFGAFQSRKEEKVKFIGEQIRLGKELDERHYPNLAVCLFLGVAYLFLAGIVACGDWVVDLRYRSPHPGDEPVGDWGPLKWPDGSPLGKSRQEKAIRIRKKTDSRRENRRPRESDGWHDKDL